MAVLRVRKLTSGETKSTLDITRLLSGETLALGVSVQAAGKTRSVIGTTAKTASN